MPSSSTRPISRCYTLQWILWRTFANKILSSLKSNGFLYKQLKSLQPVQSPQFWFAVGSTEVLFFPNSVFPRMKSISENKSIPVAYTCQIRASDLQCVFLINFPGHIMFCFCFNPKNWEIFGFLDFFFHCVVNLTNFLAKFFGNIHQIFDNFTKFEKKKPLLFLSCIRHFSWHKIEFVGCVKYWSWLWGGRMDESWRDWVCGLC